MTEQAYYNLPEGDSSFNLLGVVLGLVALPGLLSRKQDKTLTDKIG